jgi:NADH-quinone oxidoreductase subunit H
VRAQEHVWFCVPQFLGFVVFVIVAWPKRIAAFDLSGHELAAGFHQYSGMKFGLIMVGDTSR